MKKSGKLISKWIERLSWIGAVLGGVSLLVVVFLVVIGVVLRYVFRSPAAWSIELPGFLFLLLTAWTLAYVHRLRGHIGVDMLVTRLSERAQVVLAKIGSIALIIYAGFAAWGGWLVALQHLQYSDRSQSMRVPLFAVQLVLILGLILLCLQALVEIGKMRPHR